MGVAGHLRIHLSEYDWRIRTFIPHYDEMLRAAAFALTALKRRRPTVVDLGIGTGALTARCLDVIPRAAVVGLDADEGVLAVARRRLGKRVHDRLTLVHASFLDASLPRCDAFVASFALHHVETPQRKQKLYARCGAALRPGGLLVNADRMTATAPALATVERAAWKAHLRRTYPNRQAEAFLRSWAREDVYLSLDQELALMRRAGFRVDVPWRRAGFAVTVGWKE